MGKNNCGQRDLRKGVHLKVIAQTITSTVTVIGTVIVIVIISMNAIKFLLVILLLKTTTTTTSKGIITIMKIILSKMIQDWTTMMLVNKNFNQVMLSKEQYQELNHTEHF